MLSNSILALLVFLGIPDRPNFCALARGIPYFRCNGQDTQGVWAGRGEAMTEKASEESLDRFLMQRLAGGDDDALGELMNRWQAAIWCFIRRLAGHLHCTEDIYQDVWVRLYRYRKRYKPARPFRPYLFAIAVNCCRSAMKRGSYGGGASRMLSLDGDHLDSASSAQPGPLEAMTRDEDRQRVRQAIARLPEVQRTVVLLYWLCSNDYATIAQILQKRPNAIRQAMHHALANLRKTLTQTPVRTPQEVSHD